MWWLCASYQLEVAISAKYSCPLLTAIMALLCTLYWVFCLASYFNGNQCRSQNYYIIMFCYYAEIKSIVVHRWKTNLGSNLRLDIFYSLNLLPFLVSSLFLLASYSSFSASNGPLTSLPHSNSKGVIDCGTSRHAKTHTATIYPNLYRPYSLTSSTWTWQSCWTSWLVHQSADSTVTFEFGWCWINCKAPSATAT